MGCSVATPPLCCVLFISWPLVSDRGRFVCVSFNFSLLLISQDKLLNKLDEKEQDEAKTPEEEVSSRLSIITLTPFAALIPMSN